MSTFLERVAAQKAAAQELSAAPIQKQIVGTRSSAPLYLWTRAGTEQVAAVKPGFGWTLLGPAPLKAKPVADPEAVLAAALPGIMDQVAGLAPYEELPPAVVVKGRFWISRINGEFAQSPIKPGFSWREISQEEYEELTDLTFHGDEEALSPPLVHQENPKFDLSKLTEAYRAARFTEEEAEEEAAAIKELLATDPLLIRIMEESPIPLNAGQLRAAYYARTGRSFVLTGAAGTGKTTAQAATIDILDREAAFGTHDFKYIGSAPGIAIVAFTKVAVRNIQKAVRKNPRIAHYADHCMTVHALLEFEPVVEERRDPLTDELYNVRIFRPMRSFQEINPIDEDDHHRGPLTITHLVVEEASMVGIDLWKQVADALLPGVQIIYLGDINQLQPVFSNPILAYALVKLPVIELTRVYRQALDNPIIYNAHEVLKGNPITTSADGRVSVVTGSEKTKTGQLKFASAMKQALQKLFHAGVYDPEEDQILVPWNKQWLGTKAINEHVASFLGIHRKAVVQQVRAGRWDWWLAEGDKVLCDKRVGLITGLKPNPKYIGADTAPEGFYMRDGTPVLGMGHEVDFDAHVEPIDYANFSMDNVELDEGARAASHIVSVAWLDTDGAIGTLSTAGDFSLAKFDFAYAMTVHKAQGSEYRRVFMMIHQDQLSFLSRELMYTGLTRAREEFTLFAKAELVAAACKKQEVKGSSLQDKIQYFVGGALQDLDQIPVEFPK